MGERENLAKSVGIIDICVHSISTWWKTTDITSLSDNDHTNAHLQNVIDE
jgi:hypothetical protein